MRVVSGMGVRVVSVMGVSGECEGGGCGQCEWCGGDEGKVWNSNMLLNLLPDQTFHLLSPSCIY